MKEQRPHRIEENTKIHVGEHIPEALFLNLETQKIESHRPDRLTQPEQYVLLSDLLAE